MHNLKGTPYKPYRDWLNLVSFNSMIMQFLERPDNIIKAIPFGPMKAEWGRSSPTVPYTSRMMRQANEPQSASGPWIWTDYIKFYELWSKVRGKRVDSKQQNINIQTDAYVSNKKVFVILNNLKNVNEPIDLKLLGSANNTINQVSVKHLFLGDDNKPMLNTFVHDKTKNSRVVLKANATMVLEYTFAQKVTINQTSKEKKYYATTYKKPIAAGVQSTFKVNNVEKSAQGEAILRIGIGRAILNGRSPTITVNGTTLDVVPSYRGGNQAQKESFFGLLEVPVDYGLIKENNVIKIKFGDTGGHISSVALQVFNFSKSIKRFQ